MQCKGRYCREKKELPFLVKSGYFTELRCSNLADEECPDPDLCQRCLTKSAKSFRTACQQGQYQGKVDEPYYDGSWIFGSDRFRKFNTMPGNAISSEDFARAEAAQKIARQGSEMKQKASEPVKVSSPTNSTVSKRLPSEKSKLKASAVPSPPPKPLCMPIGVELLDEPLEAIEVIKIKVKRLEFNGNSYWIDTKTSDIYTSGKQNSVGKKIGIWNADEETIESEFT